MVTLGNYNRIVIVLPTMYMIFVEKNFFQLRKARLSFYSKKRPIHQYVHLFPALPPDICDTLTTEETN